MIGGRQTQCRCRPKRTMTNWASYKAIKKAIKQLFQGVINLANIRKLGTWFWNWIIIIVIIMPAIELVLFDIALTETYSCFGWKRLASTPATEFAALTRSFVQR